MSRLRTTQAFLALTLLTNLFSSLGFANDSYVYTQPEKLAEGRTRFAACFHVDGFPKDRCEPVGRSQGYTDDELHRVAEHFVLQARADEARANPTGWKIFGAAAAAGGTIGAGFGYRCARDLGNTVFFGIAGSIAGGVVGAVSGSIVHDNMIGSAHQTSNIPSIITEESRDRKLELPELKAKLQQVLSFARAPSNPDNPSQSGDLLKQLADEELSAEAPAGSTAGAAR